MSFLTILLTKRKTIINKLTKSGATSESSAKTLEEIGIVNYDLYSNVIKELLHDNTLVKTKDNKYYVNK